MATGSKAGSTIGCSSISATGGLQWDASGCGPRPIRSLPSTASPSFPSTADMRDSVSGPLLGNHANPSAAEIKETSMLTTRAKIRRPIFTLCLALAALRVAGDCPSAHGADIGVQGRWMYTTEPDGSNGAPQEM